MNLYDFLKILKKRWLIISITITVPVLISIILSFFIIKPVYKADTSIMIGVPENIDDKNKSYTYNDLLLYQNMMKSYVEIARSRVVAQDIIDKLDLKATPTELKKNIMISTIDGTEFLIITVNYSDPDVAADIANQLVHSLKTISTTIKTTDNVRILDKAIPIEDPVSPNKALNIFLAFILGLILSVGLVALIEYIEIQRCKKKDDES